MQGISKKIGLAKLFHFYKTCFELGLTKKILFISISLYFLGVFFNTKNNFFNFASVFSFFNW